MLKDALKSTKRKVAKARKAITLVELLVAAGILILICSMLFLSFANCIILNESSRNRTRATAHAQYVMEDIRNADFSTLKSEIDNGSWDWGISDIISRSLDALDGEAIDVNEVGSDSDLLDVVVNLIWQDRGTRAQAIVLETLITEP